MKKYPIIEFKKEIKMTNSYSFSFMPIDKVLQIKHPTISPFNLNQVEFFVLFLFTGGKENHTIDFEEYECKKGTLLALRKGQIHQFVNPNMTGYILKFNDEFLERFFIKTETQKSLLLFNEFLYQPAIQLTPEQYNRLSIIANQIKSKKSIKK